MVQMSEMRTASELAMSGSNHKAPRFPMKIRTFALLEFCDGGSLQVEFFTSSSGHSRLVNHAF
jgi:hypothetical protein